MAQVGCFYFGRPYNIVGISLPTVERRGSFIAIRYDNFFWGSSVVEATAPVAASSSLSADADLRARARKVIPGGMYGHLDARNMPSGSPQFFRGAEGASVWDVDGKEYLDFMCSWGPMVLGHRNRRVEAAVAKQLSIGDCLDGPTTHLVDLAERLVDKVAHADWAMFCKNGTDATSMAITVARAATGRRHILMANGSYHGIATWSARPDAKGVTPEELANTGRFEYNDLASLEAAVDAAGGDVAAIVLTPVRHDVKRDLEDATPEFARGVRVLCDRIGSVLILDEVRCGYRIDHRGSWEPLGVRPDLSAWSKAIANGYPLACLLGAESLNDAAQSITVTGSFWLGAVPLAAGLATFAEVEESGAIEVMGRSGNLFCAGLREQALSYGLSVSVTGPPQLPFMTFAGDSDFSQASLWAGACVADGLYIHPTHNWFISSAHDEAVVRQALEITDRAFSAVGAHLADGH